MLLPAQCCRFVLGNDKMATAPDLSLRGRPKADVAPSSAKREEVPSGCNPGKALPITKSPGENANRFAGAY